MTKEAYKVFNEVFDNRTIRVLDKFRHEYYEEIEHCISTGKEANVFRAKTKNGYVAVKIFRTYTSSFDNMSKYVIGDPRFTNIKKRKHDLVYLWCRKEYRNLSKAYAIGVPVPKPIVSKNNVIIMEFIGVEGNPSPLIKDALITDYQKIYDEVIEYVIKLYRGGLVHADLSEFNLLYFNKRPVFIDMAQSVLVEHPKALEFLEKDVNNLNNYFKKKCKVVSWDDFNKRLKI
ncbi:MAG: serine protein kinase RIO [Nanoarchaeota archaeon]|nr:serine protein kinase RIO [Nanoarchaeota archaeon]